MTLTAYANGMMFRALYWSPGATDGEGRISFDGVEPQIISARRENKHKLVVGPNGRETTAYAVFYVNTLVEVGGYVVLYDELPSGVVDPTINSSCRQIIAVETSPSYDGALFLIKAYVR